jgi:hypothetical protein
MVANLRGPEPETSNFGSRYQATWLITQLCVLSAVVNCESVQQIPLSIKTPSTVTPSCDNRIGILVLPSIYQFNFNGLHWYISWFSTGYTGTSVDFQRATSIYQLIFNGLNLYISLFSTGYIDTSVPFQRSTSVDFQRAKSILQQNFNGLHRNISRRSTGFYCISVDFQRANFQMATSIYQLTFNGLHQYISWLSTCYIYTSVYLHRATSIHQLT